MDFVRLDPADNVVTATRALEAGRRIEDVTTTALIPSGHKIATRAIRKGAEVRKYAQFIGLAHEDIAPGDHVHSHNLDFRATEVAYEFGTDLRAAACRIEPRVALLAHSNFGTRESPSALKMRAALDPLRERAPDLEVDGEMHADTALMSEIREKIMPDSTLKGDANLLIMPDLNAANISYNLLKAATGSVAIGPVLMGPSKPAHIVTASVSARGIFNLAAVAAVEAQLLRD